ncbi:transmembrane protein, putative (macronuclear) [Tetrahymena thermophila SB210]|uniref:Transmembrane protein, putative n=1 Tax=Tetrahymena thermophila (strain SB210) TaxID=312017 RepID=W7XJA3_TETTS|nr:transmembrane protein, putative [Tetrahymena thermophila SB210]EWS73989.1 transmembrane protein, putative [Tetrahymena thermophila SB210]|eukprot:XP_012653451.1 transmembrane protein, putative [Tetrahymena thermophila SB210]
MLSMEGKKEGSIDEIQLCEEIYKNNLIFNFKLSQLFSNQFYKVLNILFQKFFYFCLNIRNKIIIKQKQNKEHSSEIKLNLMEIVYVINRIKFHQFPVCLKVHLYIYLYIYFDQFDTQLKFIRRNTKSNSQILKGYIKLFANMVTLIYTIYLQLAKKQNQKHFNPPILTIKQFKIQLNVFG